MRGHDRCFGALPAAASGFGITLVAVPSYFVSSVEKSVDVVQHLQQTMSHFLRIKCTAPKEQVEALV